MFLNTIGFYYIQKMMKKSVEEICNGCNGNNCEDEKRNVSIIQRTILIGLFALGSYVNWIIHYFLRGELTDDMIHTLAGFSISYIFYGTVLLKVLGIPERFFIGKLDIIGYSHQIFHIGSFIGTYSAWLTYRPYMTVINKECNIPIEDL